MKPTSVSRKETVMKSIMHIAIAIIVGLLALPAGAQTVNLPILFYSQRDDIGGEHFLRMYGMKPDGTSQTRIGDPESRGFFPRYSPDATKIAFVRSVPDANAPAGARQQIFVMDADGTNQVNISNDLMHHQNAPAWFPDGRIAFIVFPLDFSAGDLWIMNADGSNQQLIYSSPGILGAWYPSVSPDGTEIAFNDDRDGDDEVYVINADGSNLRQLTNNTTQDYGVNWSPDGSRIAFARERSGTANHGDAGNGNVYVMDADGSHQIRLTMHGNDDFYPIWSPDGSKIVFSRGNGNTKSGERNIDVYVMNANGSNIVQLTHVPRADVATDWCCRSTE
jgi:Tol biopolymer transport system component